ncbi:hypothetical protein ACFVTX_18045 [Agromyces sp. NPDC058136]|uniref:hypothetical protein n=1 Tax=Agromyces sp. NPDC058136 TaxID=3346354 RepID=UPI0036DED9CA
MSGDWEQITAGEIGVGQTVEIFPFGAQQKRVQGKVDALWIPAAGLQAFPGEVRVRVKVAPEHGDWWIGPHTFLEAVA